MYRCDFFNAFHLKDILEGFYHHLKCWPILLHVNFENEEFAKIEFLML